MSGAGTNPCLGCGACCAFFRASFYWTEGDDVTPGGVPADMTDRLTPFRRVMKGMDCATPRCVALEGEVGRDARCGIHGRRASVCREFPASWSAGEPNPDCDRARARWGLGPLAPGDWDGPTA